MQNRLVPRPDILFGEQVIAFSIGHGHMQMHARPGIGLDRFGHKTGGYPEFSRLQAHNAFQPDKIIGGLQNVAAIIQRQFVLPRRIFRNHGFRRDPGDLSGSINLREKRLHPVQVVHRIDFGFG